MKKLMIIFFSLFISFVSFSQETKDSLKKELIEVDIRVKSDPTSIVISSEALEKNEALQETLNVIAEQNKNFNSVFRELNQSISEKQKLEDRKFFLEKYSINIQKISKKRRTSNIIFLSTIIFFLFGLIIVLNKTIPYIYDKLSNFIITVFSNFILGAGIIFCFYLLSIQIQNPNLILLKYLISLI